MTKPQRAARGTVGSTQQRAEKELFGDGKSATLWKQRAREASNLDLMDLQREREAAGRSQGALA